MVQGAPVGVGGAAVCGVDGGAVGGWWDGGVLGLSWVL